MTHSVTGMATAYFRRGIAQLHGTTDASTMTYYESAMIRQSLRLRAATIAQRSTNSI